MNKNKNNNCDNNKYKSNNGEVRVLPSGGDSNLILCKSCFDFEINYRLSRNIQSATPTNVFEILKWEDLKVYEI